VKYFFVCIVFCKQNTQSGLSLFHFISLYTEILFSFNHQRAGPLSQYSLSLERIIDLIGSLGILLNPFYSENN